MTAITMLNEDLHRQLLMSMKEIKEEDFYKSLPQHLDRSSEDDATGTPPCEEQMCFSHGINGEDNSNTLEFSEITSTIQPPIQSQLAISLKVIREQDVSHVYRKMENNETTASFCEEEITEMIIGKTNEQESAMAHGDVTSVPSELAISLKVIKEEDFYKILQESLNRKQEKNETTVSLCEEEMNEMTPEKKNEPESVVTYGNEEVTSPDEDHQTHSGESAYQCATPVKDYTRKLRKHQAISTGEKPYKCATRGETFSRTLHDHQRTHTPQEEPYQCSLCGKGFKAKHHLSSHMRSHSMSYHCATCGKGFSRKDHLRKHQIQQIHVMPNAHDQHYS